MSSNEATQPNDIGKDANEMKKKPLTKKAERDLERVRRKWQLASCAHFLQVFRNHLPLKLISEDTAEDLTPSMLENAIVNPAGDREACIALRDVLKALLVVLEETTLKTIDDSWFHCLSMFVEDRPSMFIDCFDPSSLAKAGSMKNIISGNSSTVSCLTNGGTSNGAKSNPNLSNGTSEAVIHALKPQSLLKSFNDGMEFLTSVNWNVRLGLLLSLCDIAAEEAPAIRNAIREAELAKPDAVVSFFPTTSTDSGKPASDGLSEANGNPKRKGSGISIPLQTISPLEGREFRLRPIGRCSRKRSFYNIGKSRIYSGYQQKGSGSLVVECSDSTSMMKLVEVLEATKHPRDAQLAHDVKTKFLGPLVQMEERKRRKDERLRKEKIEREENRRRNSHRPRREKASYA